MLSIKLLACDMDGTFLRGDRTPHPENIAAVKALVESGVTFCLASGRGIGTMRPLLAELGLTGPIVSSNGAHVINQQGEVIFDEVLAPEVIYDIVDYATTHDIHLNRYFGDTITFSKPGPLADLYQSRTGCEPIFVELQEIRQLPATKLLFVGAHDDIAEYAEHFHRQTGLQGTSIVRSEPDYLEFLPAGINKGIGFQKLAEHMELKAHQCAAIGDWLNDFEMLEWVEHSACVGNAHHEIQAICKTRVATNEQAGVAEFITSIIDINKEGIVTA